MLHYWGWHNLRTAIIEVNIYSLLNKRQIWWFFSNLVALSENLDYMKLEKPHCPLGILTTKPFKNEVVLN